MAKSALLKSSLAKKYWMALTGLFLCLFLVGHLIGNLQLIYADALQFNEYAIFMTTNPAIKVLSYVTYISIIFHAVDGILLTIQNQKARPIGYAKNNAAANSTWASRNMAVLGTLILVFIITHMVNFWAVMHFDQKMPLQTVTVENVGDFYISTDGKYFPVNQVGNGLTIKNRTEFYDTQANLKVATGIKDLHKITFAFFKDKSFGLIATLLYVLAMAILSFHLQHGFASAFQSLGANHPKYNPLIKGLGKGFAILVPFLFAIIPVYIHFSDQIHSLLAK
ncbi:succinate dehydrogenase cytochrome b subunit [Flavobacterium kingsejongi]|uniref:Succinate dehydrogenase n=1 Tax=Flavobacterium kingsejongi TaxID=1678728 RepID=A0A2S1LLB5_9FLAO|nr:succinate dehydrogenase cytochrome b subunit [Flavobacterium kingsejongi]AWG24326.1 succinate dehydrogenase [Flavobacterium kingsejongi]